MAINAQPPTRSSLSHPVIPVTMRAAQIIEPGNAVMVETEVPQPAEDELLIRIEGCGVCGSNLPIWEGREWFTYPLPPGNPGHEAWGRVVALGGGANPHNNQVGDRVTMLSYNAFAEYDVAKAEATVRLPSSLDRQPFPGEPLACAFNVFTRCEIISGQTVAIIGIGFLGAVLTGLAAGAGANVIAITRRPFALEMARRFGAAHTIPMNDHWQIIDQVQQLTNGEGCDCVIEAVGAQWPLDLASELTRIRGRLVIAGYHQDGPRQINMQLWNWRGIDVINAHERDPKIYVAGMEAAVAAVAEGRLDPSPLYTHRFKLDELTEALTMLQQRPEGFLKALILMDTA